MNRLFLCLLALTTFACDNTLGQPEGILPEKKMISMLVDLQVAESKIKTLRISSDSARHVFSIYEVQILDKHNVTQEDYLRSYEYYLENHRLMSRVHQAVLDTLLARQRKVDNMPEEPVKPAEVAPENNEAKPEKTVPVLQEKRNLLKQAPKQDPDARVLRKKEGK